MESPLDHAPCGFLSFADDGAIVEVNATLLEMLRYPRDELVGGPLERILSVGSRIFYQTHWFPLLRMHGQAEEIFLLLRASDGEEIGVLVNAVRREREGRALSDCIIMRVRERQKFEGELLRARREAEAANAELQARQAELQQAHDRLEEQARELELHQDELIAQADELEAAGEELRTLNEELLERAAELEEARRLADEANHAKSAFLAVMSHELRTPLNAIDGYSELIELGIHGPVTDAQRQALGRIRRSQRHLLRLVNDVLNLARIEAGRVEYHLADVALAEVIDDVAMLIQPQIDERGLHLERRVAAGCRVRADREKLEQILLNLLGNAVKFTPEGGRVIVHAGLREAEPGCIFLDVRDTGIGIPAEKLETIFEPFVQVDVSRASGRDGTGLGLAISRDLARGMGGELSARSEPGRGSTFTLALPQAGAR
jgi:signal transduction histidine kinase